METNAVRAGSLAGQLEGWAGVTMVLGVVGFLGGLGLVVSLAQDQAGWIVVLVAAYVIGTALTAIISSTVLSGLACLLRDVAGAPQDRRG